MKPPVLILLPVILLLLSGCTINGETPTATVDTQPFVLSTVTNTPASSTPTAIPTLTMSPLPSHTATLFSIPTRTAYPTRTQTSIPSPTLTPPPTLETRLAEEVLTQMMHEPPTPAFWGIIPEKTTLGEVKNIFVRLGIPLVPMTEWRSRYFYTDYEFESGLLVNISLKIEEDIIKNITIHIDPERERAGVLRAWSGFSPETLISRYGIPTKVDTFVDLGPGPGLYDIDLYFESVNMIIEYSADDYTRSKDRYHICPLTDQYSYIRVHIGKNPENPPLEGVSIEDAGNLTLEEFADLMMIEDTEKACIDLNREAFR